MEFSAWLLKEMQDRELSPADVARLSGLTPQAISNYLGVRTPEVEAIVKIARAFHVPPAQVFNAVIGHTNEEDELIERIRFEAKGLPEYEKAGVIEFIRFRLKQKERNHGREVGQEPATSEQG